MTRAILVIVGLWMLSSVAFRVAIRWMFGIEIGESDRPYDPPPEWLTSCLSLGLVGYGVLLVLPPKLLLRQRPVFCLLLACAGMYLWASFEIRLTYGRSVSAAFAPLFILGLPAVLAVLLVSWESADARQAARAVD